MLKCRTKAIWTLEDPDTVRDCVTGNKLVAPNRLMVPLPPPPSENNNGSMVGKSDNNRCNSCSGGNTKMLSLSRSGGSRRGSGASLGGSGGSSRRGSGTIAAAGGGLSTSGRRGSRKIETTDFGGIVKSASTLSMVNGEEFTEEHYWDRLGLIVDHPHCLGCLQNLQVSF